MTIQPNRAASVHGSHVQSVGLGSRSGPDPSDTNPSDKTVVVAGLLLILAVGGGLFNWWSSTGQSVAGDVPDSPGVDRQVDGLHVLNAYLVPGANRGTSTVVAGLVTSSGGGDRLLAVSAGGAATRLEPTVPGSAATAGLPVGSSHCCKSGPKRAPSPSPSAA